MRLEKVEIENYRSIKSCTVEFKHNCEILIGKNGAGKSNILNAIKKGLETNTGFPQSDKRKVRSDETIISSISLRYFFDFAIEDLKKTQLIYNDKNIILEKILHLLKGSRYEVVASKKQGTWETNRKVFLNFEKKELEVDKTCSMFLLLKDPLYDDKGNIKADIGTLCSCELLKQNNITQNEEPIRTSTVSKEVLESTLTQMATEIIEEYGRNVVLWKYNQGCLLLDSYSISEVKQNCTSIPLKNIFSLAGCSNIKSAFEDAIESDSDYANLYRRVSEKATMQFANKWPDMKGIAIKLEGDGPNRFLVKISESVLYSINDRSDGFKKFISILLMLSSAHDAGLLRDRLILIDEPDMSLYPSSARYLRNELINLSNDNQVLFSTHCQFMLDTATLDRHIIVSKKHEISELKVPSEFSCNSDEVLLNAIGSSLYETGLNKKNVIFEGPLDKVIFKKWIKGKEPNLVIGLTSAHGASSVCMIASLIELVGKDFLVIVDNDTEGKDLINGLKSRDQILKRRVKTYSDFAVPSDIVCLEDFYKDDFLKAVLGNEIESKESSKLSNSQKLSTKYTSKEELQQIKTQLAEKATLNDLKDSYDIFANGIIDCLNQKNGKKTALTATKT